MGGGYDVILVVGAKGLEAEKVTQDAMQFKLPEEKLLKDWPVFLIGGARSKINVGSFSIEKYRLLQQSRLSVFSLDCFGGILFNSLALKFNSPFINLKLTDKDFVKFLISPHSYFEKEPHFEKMIEFTQANPDGFPLLSLGDVSLKMEHYTRENAIEKWNERKQRVNWDNLFIAMYTESEEILQQFDALPYKKKACFVPFKSDLDSAWYINPDIDKEAKNLGSIVRRFGWGFFVYYDVFDMLLYGKKTPLIDMSYNETYLISNPFY